MRKNIIILYFILVTTASFAQNIGSGLRSFMLNNNSKAVSNELFADRYAKRVLEGKEYISTIMKLRTDAKTDFFTSLGCVINSHIGNIYTLLIPIENVEKVLANKDIIEIDLSRKASCPTIHFATEDVNADYVQQGLDLPQGYTGKDVLIGDADWGIDYTHPTFYDTSMTNYRILAAWDQFRNQGPAPEGFAYGTLLSSKQDLLAAGGDTNNIYERGSHATHVGGIAAGGGGGTQYRGIAYDAQLLFASWLVDEASVLDSYIWMRDVAKAENKRLIVNNSWGVYHFGYMDGTSLFDEFVSNLSQQDSVIFTASAGNNGDVNFHLAANFNGQDTISSEVAFNFPQPYSTNYWGEAITLAGDSLSSFATKITMYDYNWQSIYESDWVSTQNAGAIGNTVFVSSSGDSLIYRASSRLTADGRPLQDWEIRLSRYVSGTYHIVISIAAADGTVHAWNVAYLTTGVGNWGLPFVKNVGRGYLGGDAQYSIGEPAIGEGMISVAAHMSGRRGSYSYPSNRAYFSSIGPNLSGAMKPEVSAPGYAVISAYSSFTTESYTPNTTVEFEGRTYPFVAASGTSMSCPVVSGVVALMLQANPKLTPVQVREILKQTSRADNYTGEVPNYEWGWGKVDALAAVKKALSLVSLNEIASNDCSVKVFPNPTSHTLNIETTKQIKTIVIYDAIGRKVLEEKGSSIIDLSPLQLGVYLLNVEFKDGVYAKKIVKQ